MRAAGIRALSRRAAAACIGAALFAAAFISCDKDDAPIPPKPQPIVPVCEKGGGPADEQTPASQVADWSAPVRLGPPVNTPCPQDAIEIDVTTGYLYVMYTEDVLGALSWQQLLAPENNTFRLKIISLPDQFGEPEYFDLTLGAAGSFDGELSFDHSRGLVYFHSLRAENLGFQLDPPVDDFLDMYRAALVNGLPTAIEHLPVPANSIHPDGEQAIHPDGSSLYFASLRPGGLGYSDIYVTTFDGSAWSAPVNLGAPINSQYEDLQPAFTADGDTMYFTSRRNPLMGSAIYRSAWTGSAWAVPELVMSGVVGEPSLTPDGRYLYFVHVLTSAGLGFDADVWYSVRQ